jgi:hypothetical protein
MRLLFVFLFVIDFFVINQSLRNQAFANDVNTCARPIARVVDTDHPIYRFGFPICAGQPLQVSQSKSLKAVCRYSPKIILVKQLADLSACPKSQHSVQPDFHSEVVRGDMKAVPTLLLPHGIAVRKSQVWLKWKSFPHTEYLVTLDDGAGNFKSFKTSQDNLWIDSLKAGESYQIIIYANRKSSVNVLKILSKDEDNSLSSLLAKLDEKKSVFSSEEWFIFRLALLNQYDLLEESIEFASSEFNQHPESLEISRSLGDLLVSASRPDEALLSYQRFLALAQHKKSKPDVIDAQRRIQYVLAKLSH